MNDFLVYGVTGYTGRLIAEHAVERGLAPVLAGRDAVGVRSLADRLHLRHRVFDLESCRAAVEGLSGMIAVLHAAGPFSATSAPMAEACLAAGGTTSTSPVRSTCSKASLLKTRKRGLPV